MKNKMIFALIFLISVVTVRILMHNVFHIFDFSPIIVAIAFILILRDKFSLIKFKRFNPLPFFSIIIITYILMFFMILIQTHFKLSEFSMPKSNIILGDIIIALILGLTEETAWRGYLFSKLKELTWLQITIIIVTLSAMQVLLNILPTKPQSMKLFLDYRIQSLVRTQK